MSTEAPNPETAPAAAPRSGLIGPICFAAAGILALGGSVFAVGVIEDRTVQDVSRALESDGIDWAQVSANGLQVFLDGTAPDEAARFRAQARVAALIDGDRVINRLDVAEIDTSVPPRFSLDLLRNGDGIQLIGLIPGPAGDEAFAVAEAIADIAGSAEVVNMVETADFPAPPTWQAALDYGLRALETLPRSKVTVLADHVYIEAVSNTREERAEFIAALQSGQPAGVEIELDISAPRPVISPYALRFVHDGAEGRFETCTADTAEARDRIVAAGLAAGATGIVPCTIGLGVPSSDWAGAIEAALAAIDRLDGGTVSFSDADVTLVALEGTDQTEFDEVIGELNARLPEVFSLQAILPEPEVAQETGPIRFSATVDAETGARLRGRVAEGATGQSVETLALALFGEARTDAALRPVAQVPEGWTLRVLAGLSALAALHDGQLTVEPETLRLSGRVASEEAVTEIARQLSEDLGPGADYQFNVRYDEALDPVASLLSDEACVERIRAIQDVGKITFDPGSTEINTAAGAILDQIAEVMPDCLHVRMEIGAIPTARAAKR